MKKLEKAEKNLSNWKIQIKQGASQQDPQGLDRLRKEVETYYKCEVSCPVEMGI
jgi:hypothetical protein